MDEKQKQTGYDFQGCKHKLKSFLANNRSNHCTFIMEISGTYFDLGSLTRRNSVIGCIGYEFANPNNINIIDSCCVSCAICLDEITEKKNVASTACGHTFCLSCLLGNLEYSNQCPLCREPIKDVKKTVIVPLMYSDGIEILNNTLDAMRIENEIEHFVQSTIETTNNEQTDGRDIQPIIDELMGIIANFGMSLLYISACHVQNGEENIDPEWIHEFYNDEEDEEDDEDDEDDEEDDDEEDDEEDEEDEEEAWGNKFQLPTIDI